MGQYKIEFEMKTKGEIFIMADDTGEAVRRFQSLDPDTIKELGLDVDTEVVWSSCTEYINATLVEKPREG